MIIVPPLRLRTYHMRLKDFAAKELSKPGGQKVSVLVEIQRLICWINVASVMSAVMSIHRPSQRTDIHTIEFVALYAGNTEGIVEWCELRSGIFQRFVIGLERRSLLFLAIRRVNQATPKVKRVSGKVTCSHRYMATRENVPLPGPSLL
jgi:hypothetical protein